MIKKTCYLFAFILLASAANCFASTLSIDTNYRLRDNNFSSNQIFTSTVPKQSLSYYSHLFSLAIGGKFDKDIEIGSKLTALGVVGTTSTVFPLPYPKTDFTPYVENAYVKIKNLNEWPVDFIIGRQSLSYGDGLIVADNGVGYDAIKVMAHGDVPLPFFKHVILPLKGEYFTAKINTTLGQSQDSDLNGALISCEIAKNLWEIGYFEEDNYSVSQYFKESNPANSITTKAIVKRYLDFRVGQKQEISAYQFEWVKQSGYVTGTTTPQFNLDATGYLLSGRLTNEKTKLGKVTARALVSYSTGDSDPYSFTNGDNSFTPTFTRKYDGTERSGYGTVFGATPFDTFFTLPTGYSGIDTLNIGVDLSPFYKWVFSLDYFLFSASQGPKGSPQASGFEQFYGAQFSLGSEIDLSVKIAHTKYTDLGFTYSNYVPPGTSAIWPNSNAVTCYRFEVMAHF